MADRKRKDSAARTAAKKNTGLLGTAARGLAGRRNRLDEILSNATTPDRLKRVKR